MANKDGRLIARGRETQVLRSLARFGWLRTRDIAALCWNRWLPKPMALLDLAAVNATKSGLRMAQRTLKRLRLQHKVISSQAPDGSIVYALAEAGARVLQEAGGDAASGKDLVRGFSAAFFRHRCIANEVAIAAINQGFRVSTEREIAKGLWLGGEAGIFGKRPDVVIRDGKRVTFCEVEKSRKKQAEYQALVRWLSRLLQLQQKSGGQAQLSPEVCLERVVFICTQGFRTKLMRDLDASGWSQAQQSALIEYSCELYQFRDILFQ